jgi:hypothetical protein
MIKEIFEMRIFIIAVRRRWFCVRAAVKSCTPSQRERGTTISIRERTFRTVGRVVLLELDNLSTRQELSEMLTQALADELVKRHLFSVQKVMRSDAVCSR